MFATWAFLVLPAVNRSGEDGTLVSERDGEPGAEYDRFARAVIGAAIEVHRHLGPGFLESIYEEALCVEMRLRGIPFERQRAIRVFYKVQSIGDARVDIFVGGMLIVELKAVDKLNAAHTAQLLSYLKAGQLKLGLLINFNVGILRDGVQRVVSK